MEFVEGTALSGASRFCFGCEQLGGADWGDVDIHELCLAIELALSLGVNFFDTASIYGLGLSESRLADTLGEERFGVTIATKGGLTAAQRSSSERAKVTRNASAKAIRESVAASLVRLGIESLPVFFVHWPDPNTPIKVTMRVLMSLKEAGKIGSIGLSNFSCEQMKAAQQFGDVDIAQVSFSLLSKENRSFVDMCNSLDIPVCAYGVLAQGLLTGKYSSRDKFSVDDRRHRLQQFSSENIEKNLVVVSKVTELALKLGRKPAQIAIRYALQYPGISSVVIGIKSRRQLAECTEVFSWELSAREIAFLDD